MIVQADSPRLALRPNLLLSEALGAPGSPQRTWDKDDWFPMLSHKGATARIPLGKALLGHPPWPSSHFGVTRTAADRRSNLISFG
jgi:hypothetical protein